MELWSWSRPLYSVQDCYRVDDLFGTPFVISIYIKKTLQTWDSISTTIKQPIFPDTTFSPIWPYEERYKKTENVLTFLGLLDMLSQNLESSGTLSTFALPI